MGVLVRNKVAVFTHHRVHARARTARTDKQTDKTRNAA